MYVQGVTVPSVASDMDAALEEPMLYGPVAIDVNAVVDGLQAAPFSPSPQANGGMSPLTEASQLLVGPKLTEEDLACWGPLDDNNKRRPLTKLYIERPGSSADSDRLEKLEVPDGLEELEVPFTEPRSHADRPLAAMLHLEEHELTVKERQMRRLLLSDGQPEHFQAAAILEGHQHGNVEGFVDVIATGAELDSEDLQREAKQIGAQARIRVSSVAALKLPEEKYEALMLPLQPSPGHDITEPDRGRAHVQQLIKKMFHLTSTLRILPADLFTMAWDPQRGLAAISDQLQAVSWCVGAQPRLAAATTEASLWLGLKAGSGIRVHAFLRDEEQALALGPPIEKDAGAVAEVVADRATTVVNAIVEPSSKSAPSFHLRPSAGGGPMDGLAAYVRLRGGQQPVAATKTHSGRQNHVTGPASDMQKQQVAATNQRPVPPAAESPTPQSPVSDGARQQFIMHPQGVSQTNDVLPGTTTMLCSSKLTDRNELLLLLERYEKFLGIREEGAKRIRVSQN